MHTTAIIELLFLNICLNINVSISASIRHKRDLRSDLIADSHLVVSKAHSVVTELKQQNRTQEALNIEMYANLTENLTEKLKSSTNETEIIELQRNLSNIEGYLLIEFERAGLPSFGFEELKLFLIIYGEEIIERAVRERDNLNKQNKTNAGLYTEMLADGINQSVIQLKNASLTYDVLMIALTLSNQITKLEKELLDLGVGWDLENVVYIQLDRANNLEKQLTAAINKIKNSNQFENSFINRTDLINDLENDIQKITNISNHLKNTTDNNTIADLSFIFSEMELRVKCELTLLSLEKVSVQERQTLLKEFNELEKSVWRKVVELDRTLESDELLTARMENLSDLRAVVPIIVSPLDLVHFEQRFRKLEMRIRYQLKEFGV